jgi:hypothetical protein
MALKDHPENSPAGQQAKTDATKSDASVADRVADNMAKETEQGFRGVEVDPTPNENYTVAGVTSGAPTPETDDDAAESARKANADAAAKAAGVAKR